MKQMTKEEWFSNWNPYDNYLIENNTEGLIELRDIMLLNDFGININKNLINIMKGINVFLKVPVLYKVSGVIEDAYINQNNNPVLILGSPIRSGEYEIEIIDSNIWESKWGYRWNNQELFPYIQGYMNVRYEGLDQKSQYYCFRSIKDRLYWDITEDMKKTIKEQIKCLTI
jgi:hypothetical protein